MTTQQSPLSTNEAIVNPDGTPTLAFMRRWQQQVDLNGSEPVLDTSITMTVTTVNDATTLKHGFLPKLSGNALTYLDGTGKWSAPPGSTSPVVGPDDGNAIETGEPVLIIDLEA